MNCCGSSVGCPFRSRASNGCGEKVEKGKVGFKELEAYALSNGELTLDSGRQEFLENLINEFA